MTDDINADLAALSRLPSFGIRSMSIGLDGIHAEMRVGQPPVSMQFTLAPSQQNASVQQALTQLCRAVEHQAYSRLKAAVEAQEAASAPQQPPA